MAATAENKSPAAASLKNAQLMPLPYRSEWVSARESCSVAGLKDSAGLRWRQKQTNSCVPKYLHARCVQYANFYLFNTK